jgi:uncharacterized membrane protein
MFRDIILNFTLGLIAGYVLEFSYRSYCAKKIFVPQFISCFMYGLVGVCLVLLYYANLSLPYELILLFLIPSIIEFLTGYIYLKFKGIRLWDYSTEAFNFLGLVCIKFSLAWFAFASLYYYFVFPFFVLK